MYLQSARRGGASSQPGCGHLSTRIQNREDRGCGHVAEVFSWKLKVAVLTAEAFSTVLNIVNRPPAQLLFNFPFLEMPFLPLCCTVFFSEVLGPVVARAVEDTLPPQPRKSHTPKALRLGTVITGSVAIAVIRAGRLGGPVLSHLQVTASPVTVWAESG